jgi:hypothetical protein
MTKESFHPSDQQLLLFADGELLPRRAAQVRSHLAICWGCRSRMADIESTIADFMRVHRQVFDSQVPPLEGPRAQLRTRLAELARSPRQQPWQSLLLAPPIRRLAYVCLLALLATIGGRTWQRHSTADRGAGNAGLLPNPSLTPGAIGTAAMSHICSMRDDEVVTPVSGGLQEKVFREYGILGTRKQDFEVDYLITPGLGGSDDIQNLWPEPRYDTTWNSFVKDQLEEYMHHAVCGGKLSLPVAQHEIATNWIAAYKKYFHTDHPLSAHWAPRIAALSGPVINRSRFADRAIDGGVVEALPGAIQGREARHARLIQGQAQFPMPTQV